MTKYVMIDCSPMPPISKNSESRRSCSPDQPPAREREIGSINTKKPTVMTINCAMSATVIDHMPPTVAYTRTTAPPTRMEAQRSHPKSTTKTEAYAPEEVAANIKVYASLISDDAWVVSTPYRNVNICDTVKMRNRCNAGAKARLKIKTPTPMAVTSQNPEMP